MTSRSEETGRILDRFLEKLGEPLPSTVRMRRASNRVLENLAGMNTLVESDAGIPQSPRALPGRRWLPVAAVAATLAAAAVLVGALSLPSSAQPIARRLSGKLIAPGDANSIGEGKLIRSDSSGGEVLALRDGSRVEMSAGVELSIHRADDGIQIDLAEGNVIVTAAKQPNGHLYVKTRDCLVSVVGTVFSVNAEATGSRVAVIEGEVHVQHGEVSQTLLPGQQVSTNTEMKAVPLQSEIGWSQDAVVHVAMLQQAAVPAPPPAPAPLGLTVANPDLVGEIKLILAPVDQELARGTVVINPIVINKAISLSLGDPQLRAPTDSTRAEFIRSFTNSAVPSGFSFSITGIQGRTVSFNNSRGEVFSYGCADCSFVVSETGIARVVSTTEAGVEFKLSPDGNTLTASCHATQCSMVRQATSFGTVQRGQSTIGGYFVGLNYSTFVGYASQASPGGPQTYTIPTSQLSAQSNSSLLFFVTKQAGQ